MKKLFAIILSVLLLSSCGTAATSDGNETARPSNGFMNVNVDGEFFADYVDTPDYAGDRLNFFDFNSMTSAIVCPKPNCTHNDETCASFGMQNHPTIIGDKLYFFATETGWVGDNIVTSTRVYRAETDGTGRAEIGYLENLSVGHYDYMLIKGNTAYFIGRAEEWDADKLAATNYIEFYMCSFNFKTREFKNYGLVIEGYSSNVTLYGEYDGGIYMFSSYTEEKIDWSAEDAADWFGESAIYNYYRFDIDTGEIAESELPEPIFISGGFYGYQDGDNAVVLDSDGNKKVYENYELSDTLTAIPINGVVFNVPNLTALDLVNGEILYLSSSVVDNQDIVLAYTDDGAYVIKGLIDGDYNKLTGEELFVDAPEIHEREWKTFCNHPDSLALQALSKEELTAKEDADELMYFEMLYPMLPEVAQRYYDTYDKIPAYTRGSQYRFCDEGYHLIDYHFEGAYCMMGVIDTDLDAECVVEIAFSAINPETEEVREYTETITNKEGELGVIYVVCPDDGFYIYKSSILYNFDTANTGGGEGEVDMDWLDYWIKYANGELEG